MPIVNVTYETRDGFRSFLKALPKALKEVLGTSNMILKCNPVGEFDIIKVKYK